MLQKVVGICLMIVLVATGGVSSGQIKKLRTGTTVGELKSVSPAKNKRDTVIEILAPGEEKARRYTVGAQQKDLVAAVKKAQIGDWVEINWFDTVEGLCVEKFKVLKTKDKNKQG